MSQLVVLKLGQGNWQQGFPNVMVQIGVTDGSAPTQFVGSLPPAIALQQTYAEWRSLYQALSRRMNWRRSRSVIEIEEEGITNVSIGAFEQVCQQLQFHFNAWLESSVFSKVERRLRTHLSPSAEIRVIVEVEDPLLRRFPWFLWSFFDDYPQAEIALSAPEYGAIATKRQHSGKVRILAILGNSEGIDVQHDRELLEQLPSTETVFLVEPRRAELDRWLWDEQGWDILFFAGHTASQADATTGEIAINPTDSLTIAQLRNGLKAAIARGLKLAIFNSCDGLGLAREMADLNTPQLVVMREPVPDRVAQEFLKHLLSAIAVGNSFYGAMRQARERLQGLEDEFPCASWLPVLCQNPATVPMEWRELLGSAASKTQTLETESLKPIDFDSKVFPESLTPESRSESLRSYPKHRRRSLKQSAVVGLAIATLAMGARFVGLLQPLELAAFDHLMRLRPAETIDPRILVVEVTQDDTDRYGYPLSDDILATLLAKLRQQQPRAIGLDMHRYQPRGEGRQKLLAQFQQNPNLFTVCWFGSGDRNYGAPPEFSPEQAIQQVGFSDLVLDGAIASSSAGRDDLVSSGQSMQAGTVVRRQLLSYDPRLSTSPTSCTTPYSLSFQLAYQFLYQQGIEPLQVNAQNEWQFGNVTFARLPHRFGGYQTLDGLSSQVMIRYRTVPPGQRVTLEQILSGKVNQAINDRIVLIGTTAAIAKDNFETPYGEMAGIWIHAHMVSQLLSAVLDGRSPIWTLPQAGDVQWADALWILGWAAVGGGLGWRCRILWVRGLATVAATVTLHQLCLLILVQGGWVPLVPAALALWLTAFFPIRMFNLFGGKNEALQRS